MERVMKELAEEYVSHLVISAYNVGFTKHSATMKAYRCSCGKLLATAGETGEHFMKGHTLKPVTVELSWEVKVTEKEEEPEK